MKAEKGQAKVESPTRRRVRQMHPAMTAREISLALGITTQAVYKHLGAIKREDKQRESAA